MKKAPLTRNYQINDPILCADSLIICCNPNVEVIPSILEPSYVVLSSLNQRFDLAFKPPRATVKKGLLAVAVSIFKYSSQMIQNHQVIGLANDTNLHILLKIDAV